ncbi:8431_t:CDS:2, partial [Entrophospora sp. SA101]
DYSFASYLKKNNITPEQYAHYKNKSPQEQLDYFYGNKSSLYLINLKNLNFNQPSELILDNYPNLKGIDGDYVSNLTQLTITDCPQLGIISINKTKNLQQLILHNLPKLRGLYCEHNKLTTLDLSDFVNLEEIICRDNQLTQVKLPQGEKLETLNLINNNLNQDLSFLKDLVNLKKLYLNNNPLYGSLEYLKEVSKLERLDISDTDLDSGLEYLPDSLEDFKSNLPKLNQQKLQDQLKLLQEQKEKLIQRISDLETLTTENERLIKEQKNKIANNHYHFFTEEEKIALKELIKVHRAYEEAKKFKEETDELYDKLHSLRKNLKDKLGKEFIEAVQTEQKQIPDSLKAIEKNIADINKNIKALEANPKQTVNNYITTGDIEVIGGHVMIGNTIGDNTNLSHNKYAIRIEEITEETEILEAKIQQAETYGIPGSSKNN